MEVGARASAAAPAAAAEQAARAMLRRVLGPEGVSGAPLVRHDEVIATATELTQHLLRVDDCWVQPAGEFAESFAQSGADHGGAWLGNPVLSVGSATGAGGGRFRGALGAAPLWVGGERRVLMVHAAAPRAWTRWDHVVLREAALALEEALEATLGHQRTPAQEARARYDELRRQLLTVLNHELRTPLSSLSAGMELLADLAPELPPAVTRLLGRMEQNVDRLLDLSGNVTVLGDVATPHSRVDAARFEPADAVAVVELCAAGLRSRWPERRPVDVVVDGAGPVLVAVPEGELREVLDRVLDNAAKFTPAEAPIEVRVARRTSRVTITVADAGVGVPEDEQHAIGQPFFRASNARALEIQGPGLGLAAAASIARARGGTVELVSGGAEQGSVVTVRLPAAEHADDRGGA